MFACLIVYPIPLAFFEFPLLFYLSSLVPTHFPYNLHAATCPALSRTCSQPTIQQARAGPSCCHTPVETGKETDYEYNALPAPKTSYRCPVFKTFLAPCMSPLF